MLDKIVYVFAEKQQTHGQYWIGIHSDQGITCQTPKDAARQLRELRKNGYEIVDTLVPLDGLVYKARKYRDLDDKDRACLASWEKEWEHLDNYPGLFPEELDELNKFKQRGIKTGALWVSDVAFYPPGELDNLIREMGEPFAPCTTYCLAANSEPMVAGRIDLTQYITLLGYFVEVLSLSNSTEVKAKRFSKLGRPLNKKELEAILANGIRIRQYEKDKNSRY